MKKITITLLLSILSFLNIKGQSNDDYLITKTGEKIAVWGDVSVSSDGYFSFGTGKKTVSYDDRKLKYFTYAGRVWVSLPIRPNDRVKNYRMQEIICYNDNYILTDWFAGDHNIYIFDWDLNMTVKHGSLVFYVRKPRQLDVIEKVVKPHFGDCKTIIDKMIANTDLKNEYGNPYREGFLYQISMQKCGTKDIKPIIKKFIDTPVSAE